MQDMFQLVMEDLCFIYDCNASRPPKTYFLLHAQLLCRTPAHTYARNVLTYDDMLIQRHEPNLIPNAICKNIYITSGSPERQHVRKQHLPLSGVFQTADSSRPCQPSQPEDSWPRLAIVTKYRTGPDQSTTRNTNSKSLQSA